MLVLNRFSKYIFKKLAKELNFRPAGNTDCGMTNLWNLDGQSNVTDIVFTQPHIQLKLKEKSMGL